ncbi:hypothetical protein [Salinigranum sp. GCM10025319]|uniref:hypothetical protein n=1 Tax=Salinigranum sp. GCM10025319 TaxID=3252687 RepID=UPI00360CD64F
MDLVSPGTVRRRLRGLSRERFVAFVAALWAARGAETRVRGGYVEARHGDRVERLRAVTGRRVPDDSATAAADVLVLSRPASAVEGTSGFDGRVVDADDLHAMVLYAVPREAADDLCRRFFDRPLATASEPTRSVVERVPEKSAPIVVGLLGVALVVVGVLGAPLSGDEVSVVGAPESIGSDAAAQVEADDLSPTPTPQGGAEADSETADPEGYPPGLGPGGVVDAGVLADTHAKAVTGRSYRLTISHREYVDGQWNAYRRETVSVASPTEYRTDLDGAGDLRRADLVVSEVEAFADGETRYERRVVADEFDQTYTVEATPVRGVRNGEGRYADRAERYVEWFLSVSESEVVDVVARGDTRYYWVSLGEDPYVGIENSTGSALVDEHGVVHQIRRQYDSPDDGNVSAVVIIRYADFDTTTVQPPVWVDRESAAEGTSEATPVDGNATAIATVDGNATATVDENATATVTTEPPNQ